MAADIARDLFKRCDPSGCGLMAREDLKASLRTLGRFKDVELNALCDGVSNDKGHVLCHSFIRFLETDPSVLATKVKAALSPGSDDRPEPAFYAFCNPGSREMDGKGFLKLCKDCKLMDRSFIATDVDLLFAKIAGKGQRRICFEQFLQALKLIAEKRGVDASLLLGDVAASAGPRMKGTETMSVRLHDDGSTYTASQTKRLADLGPLSARGAAAGGVRSFAAAAQVVVAASPSFAPADGTSSYQKVFKAFCGTGKSDMEGASFSKLCKDCGLLDKKLTAVDIDIIFAKVTPRGRRRLVLSQFEEALWLIAQKRGVEYGSLLESVAKAGGPVLTATQADPVRFYERAASRVLHSRGGS